MVKLIEVRCPHCHQSCDIFLTTSAYLIVLNCPRCWQPIMYHDRQCVTLSKEQIRQIECANHETDVQEVLQDIARGNPEECPASGVTVRKRVRRCQKRTSPPGNAPRLLVRHAGVITGDDVTNLRIQLALCDTVDDFLGSM